MKKNDYIAFAFYGAGLSVGVASLPFWLPCLTISAGIALMTGLVSSGVTIQRMGR